MLSSFRVEAKKNNLKIRNLFNFTFFSNKRLNLSLIVSFLLFLYSTILILDIGFFGFHADDWQIINLSYNKSFLNSLKQISLDFRLIEALFWIGEFKLIGLNGQVAHFISLVLHVIQVFLFGLVCKKISKNNSLITIISILFAFFFPALANLTYLVHTDNSRLAGIFFWLAVLIFQKAYKNKNSFSSVALYLLAGFSYLLSFLTYESFVFLILLIPFFVTLPQKLTLKSFLKQKKGDLYLLSYLFFLITVGIIAKNLLSSAAIITTKNLSLLPVVKITAKHFLAYFFYIFYPVLELKSLIIKYPYLFTLFSFLTLIFFYKIKKLKNKLNKPLLLQMLYIGFFIGILGIVPFVLAGYGADTNYLASGRIYSSSSFGLALIFAVLIGFLERMKRLRLVSFLLTIIIPIYSFSHFTAGKDWRQAAKYQKQLYSSWFSQVPNIGNETNFILTTHVDNLLALKKAAVFGGTEGTKALVKIMYPNSSPTAYRAFLSSDKRVLSAEVYTIVSQKGLRPRGHPRNKPPIPLNKVIILKINNYQTQKINSISKADIEYLFEWNDNVESIKTNDNLIKKDNVNGDFINYYLKRLPN